MSTIGIAVMDKNIFKVTTILLYKCVSYSWIRLRKIRILAKHSNLTSLIKLRKPYLSPLAHLNLIIKTTAPRKVRCRNLKASQLLLLEIVKVSSPLINPVCMKAMEKKAHISNRKIWMLIQSSCTQFQRGTTFHTETCQVEVRRRLGIN